jgi:hypothetical protein
MPPKHQDTKFHQNIIAYKTDLVIFGVRRRRIVLWWQKVFEVDSIMDNLEFKHL